MQVRIKLSPASGGSEVMPLSTFAPALFVTSMPCQIRTPRMIATSRPFLEPVSWMSAITASRAVELLHGSLEEADLPAYEDVVDLSIYEDATALIDEQGC